MRHPAVEKGRAANVAPLVLGMRGSGGAPYQNLVAEPMGAPRTLSTIGLCRTFLTVLVTLILTFAGLEILTMDDGASLVEQTTTTNSWITTSAADDDVFESLVTTDEPNVQAAMNFKLSLTLDVTVDGSDKMTVSLANQTGFYAAYRNDEYLRDGFSPSFDRQRARTLMFVSEAFENQVNEDRGLVVNRKLQDDVSAGSGGGR